MAYQDGTAVYPVEVRPRGRLRVRLLSGLLVLVAGLAAPAVALENNGMYPASITPSPSQLDLPPTLAVDQQPPPTGEAHWAPHRAPHRHRQQELRRLRVKRQTDDEDEEESTQSTTRRATGTTDEGRETETATEDEDEDSSTSSGNNSERSTQTVSDDLDSLTTFTVSLAPSPTVTDNPEDSPLPSAFDRTPRTEFQGQGQDDSCPSFMSSLLDSQTYLDCYPLSMMFWTSTSFFNARKQLSSTVRVLDESCAADVSSCADFMSEAAKNLTRNENCGAEFNNNLSTVMQAYRGLKVYELIYSVSCLQDPETDMYCYANAVTNLSTSSDAFLYFLPYDEKLPGSSTPTCNWCNQETMAIFNAAAADRSQGIANTYEDAARQVNAICGPNFVNGTLPEAVESAAAWALATAGHFPPWAVALVTSLTAALAVGTFVDGSGL